MEFINSSIEALQTLVTALGAGLGVWGIVNLLEGYGNDNPGAKSQGIKQLMAGGGIVVLAQTVLPNLSDVFAVVETGGSIVYMAQTAFTDVINLVA